MFVIAFVCCVYCWFLSEKGLLSSKYSLLNMYLCVMLRFGVVDVCVCVCCVCVCCVCVCAVDFECRRGIEPPGVYVLYVLLYELYELCELHGLNELCCDEWLVGIRCG